MKERYWVAYHSAPTGYGWDDYTSSRARVKAIIKEFAGDYYNGVSVYDRVKNECIYRKYAFESKAEIDKI